MNLQANQMDLLQEASTERLGLLLGEACQAGDVICFDGDLGAGKTTLIQSITRGAGVSDKEYVCSPTFALLHEYEGKLPIYHMDFYRVGTDQEIIEIGLEDYFYKKGIVLIEWYKRVENIIPSGFLEIQIRATGQSSRSVTFVATSQAWQARITKILNEMSS